MLSMGGILRELIDNGITKGDITSISRSIIHMSIAILILGIGSFMRSFYINIISTQIVSDIRVRIYGSILKQKIQDFDQVKISDYINRFSHDINLIGDFIINFLSFSMRNIITFTGGVIMMFLQNFKAFTNHNGNLTSYYYPSKIYRQKN
jgi:ATP-binding cassette subfamily B protein